MKTWIVDDEFFWKDAEGNTFSLKDDKFRGVAVWIHPRPEYPSLQPMSIAISQDGSKVKFKRDIDRASKSLILVLRQAERDSDIINAVKEKTRNKLHEYWKGLSD